jgi:hypothetical protein
MMNYSLMPFASSKLAGGPDIRTALRDRDRAVAPRCIDNVMLLDELVESLRSLPWRFQVDHCHEDGGDRRMNGRARLKSNA